MFTFLSPKTHRKDQVIARGGICLFALFFFLCAALSALPSLGSVSDLLSQNGLAGYTAQSDNRSDRHREAIKQFTDRPASDQTSSDTTDEVPSVAPTPAVSAEHTAL